MTDGAEARGAYARPSHFLSTREFSQLYLGRTVSPHTGGGTPRAADSPSHSAGLHHYNEASSSLLQLPLPEQARLPRRERSTPRRPTPSRGGHPPVVGDVDDDGEQTHRIRRHPRAARHEKTRRQLHMYAPQARPASASVPRRQRPRGSRSQQLRQEVRATRGTPADEAIDDLYSLFAPVSQPGHGASRLRDALQRSAELSTPPRPHSAAAVSASTPTRLPTAAPAEADSPTAGEALRDRVRFLEEKLSRTTAELSVVRRDQRVSQVHTMRVELQVARSECCRLRALTKGHSGAVAPSAAACVEATSAPSPAAESTASALVDLRRRNRELEKRVVQLVDEGVSVESRLHESQKKLQQVSALYSDAQSACAYAVGRMEHLQSEAVALKKEVQILQALPQQLLRAQRELDEARGQLIEADRAVERYKQILGAQSGASPESIRHMASEREHLLELLQHQKQTELALRNALEAEQVERKRNAASVKARTSADEAALKMDRDQHYELQIQQLQRQVSQLTETLESERAAATQTLADMTQEREENLVERLLSGHTPPAAIARPLATPPPPALRAMAVDDDTDASERTSPTSSVKAATDAGAVDSAAESTTSAPPPAPQAPLLASRQDTQEQYSEGEFASSASSSSSSLPSSSATTAESVASVEAIEEPVEAVEEPVEEAVEEEAASSLTRTTEASSAVLSAADDDDDDDHNVESQHEATALNAPPQAATPPASASPSSSSSPVSTPTAPVLVSAVAALEEHALGSTGPPTDDTVLPTESTPAMAAPAAAMRDPPLKETPMPHTTPSPPSSAAPSPPSSASPSSPIVSADAATSVMATPPRLEHQPDTTEPASIHGPSTADGAEPPAPVPETSSPASGPDEDDDNVVSGGASSNDFRAADGNQFPPVLPPSPPHTPLATHSPLFAAHTAARATSTHVPLFSGEEVHMGFGAAPEPLEAYSHQTSYALAHQYSGNASFGLSENRYHRAQQLLYDANSSGSARSGDALRPHEDDQPGGHASVRHSTPTSGSPMAALAAVVPSPPAPVVVAVASSAGAVEPAEVAAGMAGADSPLGARTTSLEQSPIPRDDHDYTRFSAVSLEAVKPPSPGDDLDIAAAAPAEAKEEGKEEGKEEVAAPPIATATAQPLPPPPPPTTALVLPLNATAGPSVVPPPPGIPFFGLPVAVSGATAPSSSSSSESPATTPSSSTSASSAAALPTEAKPDSAEREPEAAETHAAPAAGTWMPPPPPVVSVPAPPRATHDGDEKLEETRGEPETVDSDTARPTSTWMPPPPPMVHVPVPPTTNETAGSDAAQTTSTWMPPPPPIVSVPAPPTATHDTEGHAGDVDSEPEEVGAQAVPTTTAWMPPLPPMVSVPAPPSVTHDISDITEDSGVNDGDAEKKSASDAHDTHPSLPSSPVDAVPPQQDSEAEADQAAPQAASSVSSLTNVTQDDTEE